MLEPDLPPQLGVPARAAQYQRDRGDRADPDQVGDDVEHHQKDAQIHGGGVILGPERCGQDPGLRLATAVRKEHVLAR